MESIPSLQNVILVYMTDSTCLLEQTTISASHSELADSAMKPILQHFSGSNKLQDNQLLDLYLCVKNKSDPGLCLQNYSQLKALTKENNSQYVLQGLEKLLEENMAIRAKNSRTNESHDYKISFQYDSLKDFVCAFRRSFHKVDNCSKCPLEPQFYFVFRQS